MTYLNGHAVDVGLLQKSHLTSEYEARLRAGWAASIYQSSYSSYARVVAVIVRGGGGLTIDTCPQIPNGSYLILHGHLHLHPVTLINFYGPNANSLDALENIYTHLSAAAQYHSVWWRFQCATWSQFRSLGDSHRPHPL